MRCRAQLSWRFAAHRLALAALVLSSSGLWAADLVPVPAMGFRLSRGFRISLYADSDLANDIYAITLDAQGRVVATSAGYITTLIDSDGDGWPDTTRLFSATRTGGMGLCFNGSECYFAGEGGLFRLEDRDFDGVADGSPEKLLPLKFAEHGGHAIRKGPDGWWYVIGGNDSGFTNQHVTLPNSPVHSIEAGALLRFTPDGSRSEAVAHGFRNPYDFDFNPLGDLFTYDSDVEADYFLPWDSPTRVYHIAEGGHHGWRLSGSSRSWSRPDYYVDTVDILAPLGRGSPTGMACYRHYQFPPYYRNGLFALDWTFGRVYFLPWQRSGASYRTAPEVFLEPMGTHGFAPTDIVVAPDGSLLISTGGRKTRGAIYRVDYPAAGNLAVLATNWWVTSVSPVEAVLTVPQPLDAWSRNYWVPAAQQIGPAPFANVIANNSLDELLRVRAVEVLTEVHGGLAPLTAAAGALANSPLVRARVAWSLGRIPSENLAPLLSGLAADIDPLVRRCALEALSAQAFRLDPSLLRQAVAANLADADKRVRQAAARLARDLPEPAWTALWTPLAKADPQSRLTATLALLWRGPQDAINTTAIESALSVLVASKSASHRLQALRLILLALGDYHLHGPSVEVYTGYEAAFAVTGPEALMAKVRAALGALLPSGDGTVDFEAARLLAILQDNSPAVQRKIVSFFTDKSSPSDDFHYLTVLSRLKGAPLTNTTGRIAHALLSLDRKLAGLEVRHQQNWPQRLAEIAQSLLGRDPSLANAMIRDPDFARPSHLPLVPLLGSDRYLACARLYFERVQRDSKYPWSGPLIQLLSSLPSEQVYPLLRRQWPNIVLRDDLVLVLSRKPEGVDRDKFVTGLSSPQPEVLRASMSALLQLPRPPTSEALTPALRLLRRLLNQPPEQAARAQLLALLTLETGQPFKVQEPASDAESLKRAYQPVFTWFIQRRPTLVRRLDDSSDDPVVWEMKLKSVPWDRGDYRRGEVLFAQRGCQICHTGSAQLGPDLSGVTARFSVNDLFAAIVFPNRDIAPRYRLTTFSMRGGQVYTGLTTFESADGVLVQTSASTTVRLADRDILTRQPSDVSLMPSGLLAGLDHQALADLYSYLETLASPK